MCSVAFEASSFIKHVIKARLKKNRPSSWRRLTRPNLEKAGTKSRRTSLRIRFFVLLLAVVARAVSFMRVLLRAPLEPVFPAGVATVVSTVGCKSGLLHARVAYSAAHILQEPVSVVGVATVVSTVGQKMLHSPLPECLPQFLPKYLPEFVPEFSVLTRPRRVPDRRLALKGSY